MPFNKKKPRGKANRKIIAMAKKGIKRKRKPTVKQLALRVDELREQGLNPNRIAFIDEYMLNGFNATKAYMVAYGETNAKTASANGAHLTANNSIKNEINYRLASQLVTNNAVIANLWEIATKYRGHKTLPSAVKSLEILAKINNLLIEEKTGDKFFQNNYLVYAPITTPDERKRLDAEIAAKGRIIE